MGIEMTLNICIIYKFGTNTAGNHRNFTRNIPTDKRARATDTRGV